MNDPIDRIRSRTNDLLAVLSIAACVSPAVAGPPQYRIHIFPPVAESDSVFATAMADRGPIVGLGGSDPFDPLAVPVAIGRGTIVELPQPTDSLNFPLGVARGGLVAGTASNLPYLWIRDEAVLLRPAGGLPSGAAWDVNAAQQICGYVINDFIGAQFPAYWPDSASEGMQLPGLGGSAEGAAFAINEKGQIAGATGGVAVVFYGARWDDPTQAPVQIGPLPGAINSELLDVNEQGDTVGRSSFEDGTVEAMLHVAATDELIGLGQLDGNYSFAHALNEQRLVVGTATAGSEAHAFLWQDGVMYDLNDLLISAPPAMQYISNAVGIDELGNVAAEVVVSTDTGTATRVALLMPQPTP